MKCRTIGLHSAGAPALALAVAMLSSCAAPASKVSVRVDPTLRPAMASVPSKSGTPQPVAAVRSDAGPAGDLVEAVLRVRPRSPAQLQEFLDRYGGVVIDDNEVPIPPPERRITLTDEQRRATEFVVRIDLSRVDPRRLEALARDAGWRGPVRFSSDAGLRTFVAALAARAAGYQADANFVVYGHQQVLLNTEEREITPATTPPTFTNAFNERRYGASADAALANVGPAWQYTLAHGLTDPNVEVAIIDSGFYITAPGGIGRGADHDFPFGQLWQTDLINDDGLADEAAPAGFCGMDLAGNIQNCAWHGTWSTSVATGVISNRRGSAGTGSVAATPMLYRVNTTAEIDEAIMAASVWGADVVSLSLGGGLNTVDLVKQELQTAVTDEVLARFVNPVFVASAGNSNVDVGYYYRSNGEVVGVGTPVYPCIMTHVVCVGALNNNALTKVNYSNFGSGVDLYAPTNIPVMSTPDVNDVGYGPFTFSGTSASAPFVSGIAAMMKALNPGLSSDQATDILRSTGHAGTAPVNRAVDALAAVRRAAQGIPIRPDRFEPNNGEGAATNLGSPANRREANLNLDGGDRDYFAFNAPGPRLATIDVEFPTALGPITIGAPLQDDDNVDGCPAPGFAGRTLHANGYSDQYFVNSGRHVFNVRASDVNAYNLTVSLRAGQVPQDEYESNDSPATATREPFFFFWPASGGGFELTPLSSFLWRATIDSRPRSPWVLGDTDYYSITGHEAEGFMSAGLKQLFAPYSGVRVYANDAPVTMRVYLNAGGALGTQVGNAVSAGPCGSAAIQLTPGTAYIVEVTGSQGRYSLHNGTQARTIPIPWLQQSVIDQILQPGGPVEIKPRDPEHRFITVADRAFTALQASGPGVHLRLLDERKVAVSEGVVGDSGGEVLNFANTRHGAAYVIETSAVDVEGEPQSVRLTWQTASPPQTSGNLLIRGSNTIQIDRVWAAAIAEGRVMAQLSADLDGQLDNKEAARARATFLDPNRRPLGSISFGPITAAELQGKTAPVRVSSRASVPKNAAYIVVDTSADNVEVILMKLP